MSDQRHIVDPAADIDPAPDAFVPRGLHWSDSADPEGPEWRALREARRRARVFWGGGRETKHMRGGR